MIPPNSLYAKLKAAGCDVQPAWGESSDLHVKGTAKAREILMADPLASSARPFTSQIDGSLWYEVPFAYLPFWEKVQERSALLEAARKPKGER